MSWSPDSHLVDGGQVTTQTITDRARAVLQLLQRTGKLTSQLNAVPEITKNQSEHKELIREAVAEGIVLLRNGRNILPLNKTELKKIALLGPMAKYSDSQVSPFDDFNSRLGKDVEITYSQGIILPKTHPSNQGSLIPFSGVSFGPNNPKKAEYKILAEALALAREADYAICFIGDTERGNLELENFSTEASQCEFVSQIAKGNPNTIVVNTTEKPILVPFLSDVAALLQTWYTGPETSHALLDVLLGDVSPSGRLPVSWCDDLDGTNSKPVFPFGYGLSYTTFAISNPRLFGKIVPISNEGVTISLFVENTGSVAGGETIQAYISPPSPTITETVKDEDGPNKGLQKKLVAFAKVFLEPSEKRLVTLNFEKDAVASWDVESGGWKVEGGMYRVLLGSSSRDEDLNAKLEMGVKESFGFPA